MRAFSITLISEGCKFNRSKIDPSQPPILIHCLCNYLDHSCLLISIKGGKLLPVAPLQPCAPAPSGKRHTILCWTVLTWPQKITPALMPALQYRHKAHPRHGTICRGPSSGGFIRALPVYFPPNFTPINKCCLLLRVVTFIVSKLFHIIIIIIIIKVFIKIL